MFIGDEEIICSGLRSAITSVRFCTTAQGTTAHQVVPSTLQAFFSGTLLRGYQRGSHGFVFELRTNKPGIFLSNSDLSIALQNCGSRVWLDKAKQYPTAIFRRIVVCQGVNIISPGKLMPIFSRCQRSRNIVRKNKDPCVNSDTSTSCPNPVLSRTNSAAIIPKARAIPLVLSQKRPEIKAELCRVQAACA